MHMKQHGMAGMRLRCPHCDFSSNRDDYMQNHVEGHVGLTNGVIPGACAGVQPMTSPKPSARTAAPGKYLEMACVHVIPFIVGITF